MRLAMAACAALGIGLFASGAFAQELPTSDLPGASDSDVVGRLPGSVIVSHFTTPLDQAEFPKSKLKRSGGTTGRNVSIVSPDESLKVEGARTRNVYLLEPGVPPFAAARAYEDTLAGDGAELVYACSGDNCGGRNGFAGGIGGNVMSLAYYVWPDSRIVDDKKSAGMCAQTGYIKNQEYRLFRDEAKDTTVSVHAYTLNPSQFSDCKKNFTQKTVVAVDVIAPDSAPIELTTVTSDEMQSEISATGKIALYGINFDSGKDSLRADSAETIIQIAELLKSDGELRLLIVGHTDAEGSFDFNQDLSERRAGSVVRALIDEHGIARERLFPVGVSFASPVATNDTEDGRAQNRRVELVKF